MYAETIIIRLYVCDFKLVVVQKMAIFFKSMRTFCKSLRYDLLDMYGGLLVYLYLCKLNYELCFFFHSTIGMLTCGITKTML